MTNQEDLLYSKDHEWVSLTEDKKIATIGITDFAQKSLGDVVYVELPEVGKEIKVDEVIGSVESVKSVSDVFSPVSGKIIEINEDLENKPELVNLSPYQDGWFFKVELIEAVTSQLLHFDEYQKIAN